MNENLIHYISKLSTAIVTQQLENDKNLRRCDDKFLNRCVKNLRKKGFDILLRKTDGTQINDPCVTDYGGNWSPLTLITDYGRELKALGAGKANDKIVSCISILTEKDYDCVNDLLKLLLLLKRPLDREPLQSFQSEHSFSCSDFLLKGIDSLPYLNDALSNEDLSEASSFRKNLYCGEKHFQVLGELSKKSYQFTEKLSLNSIQPSKLPLDNSSQSRPNSFVLIDFLQEKKHKSEKSLFDIYSCPLTNETPLLDTFVDNPIKHKLPLPTNTSKIPLKADSELSNSSTEYPTTSEQMKESNVIELKRDSNCSHSFSILYKKSMNSQHSCFGSNSTCCFKDKKKEEKKSDATFSSSKDIILGLWEHEVSLIKEFKPELAPDFPELRMVSMREFVSDLKYLLTGIDSGTFRFDSKENSFHMVYGTCLNDVTPESLFHFSKDFIEIGNCYTKLTLRLINIGISNFDTCTTISQAFWKSIFDFLELHYAVILEIPDNINLMYLKSSVRDIHDMITTIANICMIEEPKENLPKGGALLSYLMQIAELTFKNCLTNTVFGILKNCCSVYFSCILENWMFKGELEIGRDEFFVGFRRQKVKTKSRAYYSSFYLVDEKVPSFLRGFEDKIYNCGKSVHFLKLFNPEDKFCQILNKAAYPPMRVCFSEEALNKLEQDFKTYEERVIKTCGEKITIKTIREEEKEKEKAYIESIREFKKMEEKQREEAREKTLKEKKAKKDKQNKELNRQRNLIEMEKKKIKEKEQAEELRLKEEIEKANLTIENLINQEKNLMINKYNNLMDALDRRIIVAEKRKEILIENLNNTNETIDNRIQTDNEGNITNEVDINSNRSEEIFQQDNKTEFYDENSNPSLKIQHKSQPEVNKNMRFRTPAAEEAERNKFRVLRSEFALPVTFPKNAQAPPETKPNELITFVEGSKGDMMESEPGIILETESSHLTLKSTRERLDLSKEIKVDGKFPEGKSDSVQSVAFDSVELKPKPGCSNFTQPSDKPPQVVSDQTESTDSLAESQTKISLENELEDEIECRNPSRSSLLLSDYQNALVRDAEITLSRISTQDAFCSLKEKEVEEFTCKNYCTFLKYLKKSIFIPLSVQERLANDALLKHLLKGENLLSHLNSLRGYFFLNDGEFGRSFTHHTFRSLAKCTESSQFFEKSNLNNIVNEALNYTIHNYEPNAQNLSFRIGKMPPFLNHSSHDVLSPFELTYKVDWPLNIILTEKALSKYKMVFRFLLKLKRINWTLNENFSFFNWQFKSKRLNGKTLVGSPHFHKIQVYRHAMTQVVITIDDYIFSNGIQLPWIVFQKDLETTNNIDDLYQKHVRYIKDVLTRCFLSSNSEDLLDCVHSLIELALKFHYTAKTHGMELVDGVYVHPKYSVLKTTFNEFCFVLKTFLKTLKEKLSSNQVIRAHYVLLEKFDQKLT